jgi:hypothetical protein
MERIDWREISSRFIASNWTELEAFAVVSMRGLCHKVRHKIERSSAEVMSIVFVRGRNRINTA